MKNFVVNTFYKQRQDFERDAALHDKKFSMPKDVKEWKDLPYNLVTDPVCYATLYHTLSCSTFFICRMYMMKIDTPVKTQDAT